MIEDLNFAKFLAWFFFRLNQKDLNIFLDIEGQDLAVHLFMVGEEPPIHRKKLIRGFFKGYDQAAEFLRQRISSRRSRITKEAFDAELINAITYGLGFTVLTFEKDGLKIKTQDGKDLTDMDGYIPEKQVWIEVTSTSREVDRHFFDKLGRLMYCQNQTVLLETREFDSSMLEPQVSTEPVDMSELKLFYVSLYPVKVSWVESIPFCGMSLLDSSKPDKIRAFIGSPNFEENLYERFSAVREMLSKFTKKPVI